MVKSFFTPAWPLPAGVRALISTRLGGVSSAGFSSNNLALHVNDDAQAVRANRLQLLQSQPSIYSIQWLNQVHGNQVVKAIGGTVTLQADAQYTQQPNLACAILTADCLPVLFCNQQGTQVAAAHAGWRGLANGILLNTLATFARPEDVSVYLGPAIGFAAFEIGPEVKAAFPWASSNCFRQGQGDRYYANLYQLAQEQLKRAGVTKIYGGEFCTHSDSARFYSYRRESVCGRMASLIWLEPK